MAETDTWPLVVCDAGPLIHLDEIDCLELLARPGSKKTFSITQPS
jgi:hypothetical protein